MTRDWKLPWTGGCRCGQIRFKVSAPPMLSMACHCSGCQQMTASAYSLSLIIPSQGFEVTEGEPVVGALHGPNRHLYCGHCKSWLFTQPQGLDYLINVRAPQLDDHSWFVPFMETGCDDALPWARTPAKHSYPMFPEADVFPKLIAEFATDGAGPG